MEKTEEDAVTLAAIKTRRENAPTGYAQTGYAFGLRGLGIREQMSSNSYPQEPAD